MSVITQESDISIIRTVETERIVIRQVPAPGPAGPPGSIPLSFQTELELDVLYPNSFKEILYTGELVSQIFIWDSPAKLFKIFSKVFIYNTIGRITQVTTTLELVGSKIVKIINYDSTNRILSVDKQYTP